MAGEAAFYLAREKFFGAGLTQKSLCKAFLELVAENRDSFGGSSFPIFLKFIELACILLRKNDNREQWTKLLFFILQYLLTPAKFDFLHEPLNNLPINKWQIKIDKNLWVTLVPIPIVHGLASVHKLFG